MDGGMRSWKGLVADGPPESGMAFFPAGATPEEMIGLAWVMEEGSRKFYAAIPGLTPDPDMKELFETLVNAEEHHKETLVKLYRELSGQEAGQSFPGSVLSGGVPDDVMEGGMRVSEGLQWVRDKESSSILELSVSLETHAHDLYLKMFQRMQDDSEARKIFHALAEEEKSHLARLTALLEERT